MSTKIKAIQRRFSLPVTGNLDNRTRSACKNILYRLGERIPSNDDEIVTSSINALLTINSDDEISDIIDAYNKELLKNGTSYLDSTEELEAMNFPYTTDLTEKLEIKQYILNEDEYCQSDASDKHYIFLHHTAGPKSAERTIQIWNSDRRGRIGTHFVIDYDGTIVQAIPDNKWAYHLGGTQRHGIDFFMHKHSIGIEICSWGWLKERDGLWYNWAGDVISESEIEFLDTPWRGYTAFHKYSNEQIKSVGKLVRYLSEKYDIEVGNEHDILGRLKKGFNYTFAFNKDMRDGKVKGLLAHCNVRKDKTDVYPNINLLNEISQNLKKYV